MSEQLLTKGTVSVLLYLVFFILHALCQAFCHFFNWFLYISMYNFNCLECMKYHYLILLNLYNLDNTNKRI